MVHLNFQGSNKHQLNLPPRNMGKQELMGSSESSASLLPYGRSNNLQNNTLLKKRKTVKINIIRYCKNNVVRGLDKSISPCLQYNHHFKPTLVLVKQLVVLLWRHLLAVSAGLCLRLSQLAGKPDPSCSRPSSVSKPFLLAALSPLTTPAGFLQLATFTDFNSHFYSSVTPVF